MKKFIVFCMLCCFLFSLSLLKPEFDFSKQNNLSVQIFLSNRNFEQLNNYSTVQNGQGAIITCSYDDYKNIKKSCKDISGVTFVFDGDKNSFDTLKKELDVTFATCSNYEFTGYTNYCDYAINLNNKKVNVQACLYNNKIFVGFPLLLGSY